MISILETIAPKSDQLSADDFIGKHPKTIKITKVSIVKGEQPATFNYEGDEGKPYKPGLSMRRVIIHGWGDDATKYVGRSLTLYRDEKVRFGGMDVGGIRISHMSHIDHGFTLALTATRANKKPFTVKPLVVSEPAAVLTAADYITDIQSVLTLEGLQIKFKAAHKQFAGNPDEMQKITEAKDKRKLELTPSGETPP